MMYLPMRQGTPSQMIRGGDVKNALHGEGHGIIDLVAFALRIAVTTILLISIPIWVFGSLHCLKLAFQVGRNAHRSTQYDEFTFLLETGLYE